MSKIKLFSLFTLFILVLVSACDESGPEKVDFDREAMLVNMADGLIIPAYADFQSKAEALHTSIQEFADFPNVDQLEEARATFKAAWKSWQYVGYFEFGPAMSANLRNNLNVFPTDTEQIQANIASGSYDLASAVNIDAKGFPALDYLLFGVGETAQNIAGYYDDETLGNERTAYLKAVSGEINELAGEVSEEWQNYRTTFVSSLGTETGSSTALLVNELNFHYDQRIKNGKIGIPAGKKSLGETLPDKVEALYSGMSVELAVAGLQAFQDIFTGTSFANQQNDSGLDDYLNALNAQYNEESLSSAILNQIELGIDATKDIPPPLSDAVDTHSENVDNAYLEIQRLVALIKVDMTSALGVLITYQDNDGD